MTRFIAGLADIIDAHDAFIFDQWGVMHNGANAYPGVHDALAALARAGKRVAVLSNSGKRSSVNEERLAAFGFQPGNYAGTVSGGETLWQSLAAGQLDSTARYFVISWDDAIAAQWCAGLDCQLFTTDISVASGVIVLALPVGTGQFDEDELLASMLLRGQIFYCGNPDVRAPGPCGLMDSPGRLAARYEDMGGTVLYYGKPYAAAFELTLKLLDEPVPERTLMVGDNLATDIVGAARLGLPSLLLRQGVHAVEFGLDENNAPTVLVRLLAQDTSLVTPTYCSYRL